MSLKASNKVDTNLYELTVEIDAETFEKAIHRTYLRQKNRINVPGFRKGKAPRAFIEKLYGADVFHEDALELIYPETVEAAIKEAGLTIVDAPSDVNIEKIGKEGVSFTMKVTVKPEVELGEYKGLKAEKKPADVTDAEIDAEIERMRDRNSRMVTVEGRAAQDGDLAEIDFEGFVGDEAFEGGKAENYTLTIGSHQFIPGFEEQLIGHSAGDEFEIAVTFPEDYAEELAGKDATFRIKLHEIKVKELPAVDDEFAKDVSEFETVDELKNNIRENIAHQKEHEADDDVESQLIDGLLAGLKAEIPDVMYDKRVDEDIRNFEYRMQSQGLTLDAYLQYTGMEMEKFRESFRAQAERQVKTRLAFEKIVELENIQVSDEELDAEFQKLADQYQMDVEAVKKAIPADDMREDLAVNKAIELVKESAEVTEGKAEKKTAKKPAAKKTAAKKTADDAEEPAKKPAAKKAAAKKPAKKAEEEQPADAE